MNQNSSSTAPTERLRLRSHRIFSPKRIRIWGKMRCWCSWRLLIIIKWLSQFPFTSPWNSYHLNITFLPPCVHNFLSIFQESAELFYYCLSSASPWNCISIWYQERFILRYSFTKNFLNEADYVVNLRSFKPSSF